MQASNAEDEQAKQPAASSPEPRAPLPQGYRQGIITAITVLLGFSLAFVRFWGFEAPGPWRLRSIFSAVALLTAIALQLIALFRSLRLEDDDPVEYRRTVVWFLVSALALVLGLLIAAFELSGMPDAK
jgi:4-amino-4-deoxy-L-arabinose transferase-like glycosyltransferase